MDGTLWRFACLVIVAAALTSGSSSSAQESAPAPTPGGTPQALPAGLFDPDHLVRLAAVEQVAKDAIARAESKLVSMVQTEPFADVRRAACEALAAIGATSRIELLRSSAANDPNTEVRAAAARAARKLAGEPEPATTQAFPTPLEAAIAGTPAVAAQDGYRRPELKEDGEAKEQTRLFAVGLGTMGGYGIAALDLRFRIATGNEILPWVGLELGGGWSPPNFMYWFISGMMEEITKDQWLLISGAGGVLLYFHRLFYVPVRAGFDLGQGPYFLLGGGFEGLNDEGFFSWGVEAGILVHPWTLDYMKKVTDCGAADQDPNYCEENQAWPVIPFIRFSLHFYLV
ncbi:MAG: HEAT repeat domain-containing protein [Deltaproteobacteria bacterium]|nr:HEAT repeat domain-containing protein [Deltaproteobacteria bacterium]